MKRLALALSLSLLGLQIFAAPVALFDGHSLAGWEGDAKWWRVEDGALTGGSRTEKVPRNFFLATTRSFHNFDLRLRLKLTGDPKTGMINSGVQIRSLRVPGSSEMSGYQVDYGAGWYGKLYDESRRNKVVGEALDLAAAAAAIRPEEWNEYRIRTDGARIQSWINGVPALDYTEADPQIAQDGSIGIQIHSGGQALVQVKDVTIEELPPTPNAPTWEKIGGVEGARAKLPPTKSAAATPAPKRDLSYNAVASAARTPEEERASFTVPAGFEVELVAAEDPANGIGKFVPIAFDQKDALWTTTALEYPVDGNENPAAADALYASQAKDKVLVYDRDLSQPTGYATKPRVFAEGLAIPLGVLPYKNGCYVQHGHDIAFLEDTDGDGRSDKRTVILTGFGVQDSHLFPHQFLRAPGGWIWMAQGAFNYSKVRQPNEPAEKAVQFDQTRMAKFRPDGSGFDITSNGPCNIWGLVLNGEGEAFIQEANDFGYPVMPFHEYANYPGCSDRQWKSYAPEFPGTAPDFKMGGTGLSGLAILDEGWARLLAARTTAAVTTSQTVLIANPITNRIQAIVMHRDGPYWKLDKPTDFLVSSDSWFRPVAITVGPDGCLYIVDWYNKIISHNEVPRNHPDRDKTRGRIWRVKATAQLPFEVLDFTKLTGDQLISKLGGASLAQSHLAWQQLEDRRSAHSDAGGTSPLPDFLNKLTTLMTDRAAPVSKRIQAMWARDASPLDLAHLLSESDRNLRREASKMIGNWSGGDATGGELQKCLGRAIADRDPEVRSEVLRVLGQVLNDFAIDQSGGKSSAAEALTAMLTADLVPLVEPTAPSTHKPQRTIKVREAYDREFERYLMRMFLERHPDAVAKFLDSEAANPLPVEARLLATLALEPKASAARVAKLLPQLQRAPGQEEVLRLAQFTAEPGVGDALKNLLQNPASRTAALEALLATRTRLDDAQLTPFLTDAVTALLANPDPASLDLGVKLAAGFKLASAEPALVALLPGQREISTEHRDSALDGARALHSVAALRALAELGSTQTELFAKLAITAPDAAVRDEALAALAASRATDAPARVLALFPQLTASQRRNVLGRLVTSKSGAQAVIAALKIGTLAKTELDGPAVDKLQAVLPGDADVSALFQELGALFRLVLLLDGTDVAWTQTAVTLDGPCTIETWVRLDPQGRKIGNADGICGAPGQIDLNFYGGKFRVFGFVAGDVAVAKKPVVPGLWTHVAATRDAAGMWKLYVDGELDAAGTKPAPQKIENVRIGWSTAPGGTAGLLAEFRIWKVERTAEQIRAACDRRIEDRGRDSVDSTANGLERFEKEHLIFSSADGNGWAQLQAGAKIIKTNDFPPILSAEEATALDAKYAHFRELAAQPGDAKRGLAAAALCQACHLMGATGGNIGPNLSGVGAMGVEAILRNVLQPNAAMENGYRIYRVEMKNGDLVDALFVSEDADAVIVRLPGSDDRRLAKKDIRAANYLRRSLMPDGLLDAMPPEQVRDLFAYLKTLK